MFYFTAEATLVSDISNAQSGRSLPPISFWVIHCFQKQCFRTVDSWSARPVQTNRTHCQSTTRGKCTILRLGANRRVNTHWEWRKTMKLYVLFKLFLAILYFYFYYVFNYFIITAELGAKKYDDRWMFRTCKWGFLMRCPWVQSNRVFLSCFQKSDIQPVFCSCKFFL